MPKRRRSRKADFTLYWMNVMAAGAGKPLWRLTIWPENGAAWGAVRKLTHVTKTDVESGLVLPKSNKKAFGIANALVNMGFKPAEGGDLD